MPEFYVGPGGYPTNDWSHTQYNKVSCPREYFLDRVEGWTSWPPNVAFEFGKIIEPCIRAWVERDEDPVALFNLKWSEYDEREVPEKDRTNYHYTKTEKDWENLSLVGQEMMTNVQAVWPNLGIQEPRFYTYQEAMDDIGKRAGFLEDSALQCIPDCIDWPDKSDRWGGGARLIDIKTTGAKYPEKPEGIVSMAEQLRVQSWVTKIERVAFLVFFKGSPKPTIKGDCTYMLRVACQGFVAGDMVIVATPEKGSSLEKQLKKSKQCLVQNKNKDGLIVLDKSDLTGCTIRLIEGRTNRHDVEGTIKLIRESAEITARRWALFKSRREELVQIGKPLPDAIQEARTEAYPQHCGITFPHMPCTNCDMLPICLGDEKGIKETLRKKGDDWLEDL